LKLALLFIISKYREIVETTNKYRIVISNIKQGVKLSA